MDIGSGKKFTSTNAISTLAHWCVLHCMQCQDYGSYWYKSLFLQSIFAHRIIYHCNFGLLGFFAIPYNVDFGPSSHYKCPLPNSSIFHISFYVEETSVTIIIDFRPEHLTHRTRYFGARTSHRWCLTTKRVNAISSTARRSVRPFRMKSRRSCRWNKLKNNCTHKLLTKQKWTVFSFN